METRLKTASFIGMAIGFGVALGLVLACIGMGEQAPRLVLPLIVCLVLCLLAAWGGKNALHEPDQTEHDLL